MNAKELFLASGESAGVWYCDKCHRVGRSKQDTEGCCQPRVCECGAECSGYSTSCYTCVQVRYEKRIAANVALARHIPEAEWEGPVWPEGSNGFSSLDDMRDHYDCRDESIHLPVWGTRPDVMCFPHARDLVDSAIEEMYEGAIDEIGQGAIDELQVFLDEWTKRHGPKHGYVEDNSVVIDIDR